MNPETLPSFLRRRNGRLELVLHATGIQQFKVCPLKFWLNNGLWIERAVPKTSLNYGGAIHEALAVRYRNEPSMELDVIASEQVVALVKWFADRPAVEGEWRNLARAEQAIRAYNKRYPTHEWTVLGVEEEFEVEVGVIGMERPIPCGSEPPYETVPVVLAGRKDLIVAWHDGVWVVDHKTASEWGSDPETNQELLAGRRSFQFRGYAWAERERKRLAIAKTGDELATRDNQRDWLPVRGVVGNYIIGRKPYSEAASATARRASSTTLKPRDDHHQEFFAFDDATLDEWRDQFLIVAGRVLRCWKTGEWEASFDRGCAHYGRCEFYDYCEESPSSREATLTSSLYRQRDEPQPSTLETEP